MPSPLIFRKWAAICLVGGACERRVWTQTGPFINYLNNFVLLVAAPGIGKYIVSQVRNLWAETLEPGGTNKAFSVAPDSRSKASLMDTLAKSKKVFLPPKGSPIEYSSLLIAAEEFSVLMPGADTEYAGALNSIWNNNDYYEETRRASVVKELFIDFPQLNMLGGIQPQYLSIIAPDETWNTGLARRMIMVYSAEQTKVNLRRDYSFRVPLRQQLLFQLGQISRLYGELNWSPEAFDKFDLWFSSEDLPPRPSHSKLEGYCNSRGQFIMKLVGISAISRGSSEIDVEDIDRAWSWLFEAEAMMPDIFRAQLGKSEAGVTEEMCLAMHKFMAEHRKSVPGELMAKFLVSRVPSYKVKSIIENAHAAGIIKLVDESLNLWQVEPKYSKMVE